MKKYIVFYNNKKTEIIAESLYSAKLKAIDILNIPKSKQGLMAVSLNSEIDNGNAFLFN